MSSQDQSPKNTEVSRALKLAEDARESDQRQTFGSRLTELARKPKRHPAVHWTALVLSVLSIVPLALWLAKPDEIMSGSWYTWDIFFSIFFLFEFVTRSGFRWDPSGYTRTHFFDFVAIVPALVLVHYNIWGDTIWFWIIFAARLVRALDRILGDGFIRRNALAVAEGFEEEITDRVMIRILDRVQADLDRGHFGQAVATAIENNKQTMLKEIRTQHPRLLESGLAQAVGITGVLEKAEENIYEAIVKVLKSPELDKTIRQTMDSTFSTMRASVNEKSWKKNLGFRRSSGR
jgi:hypothetical protein